MSGKFILIDISSSYRFDSRMIWKKEKTCYRLVHFKQSVENTHTREIKSMSLLLVTSDYITL